jgi:hypothetical protein
VQADARGLAASGASARALESYERSLEDFLAWSGDPLAEARRAVEEAPAFVMGHVLIAQLLLCSRDPAGAHAARASLERARALPSSARERMHMAAVGTSLAGDWDRARELLACILARHPRDLLALAISHTIDYYLGETRGLRRGIEAALPAWTRADRGYAGVIAMLAFGLEESGAYGRAEEAALEALMLEPRSLRAHHARAHVLEMQGRAAEGVRWAEERRAHWDRPGASATHVWWHLALHHLELGDARRALEIHDARIAGSAGVSELIDAAALLWRLQMRGADLGARWAQLAALWEPRAEEAFCAFNDLHAMLAFVGAGRRDLQRRLLRAQRRRLARGGTNEGMLRSVGLPAAEALAVFGRGDYARAAAQLRGLPEVSHRLGGSHAQRGILGLTLREAEKRLNGDRPHFSHLQMRKIGSVPI